MEQGVIMQVAQGAMMTVLYLTLPMLGISLVVGLLISIFQATTSIQEQTLTFIPKLITILLSIALFCAWMGKVAVAFSAGLYEQALQLVR